jgi:MFS family permease
LALTLLVGTVADSYDRRKVVLLAQITPFLCGLSLAYLTHTHEINLLWLYALVFCIACSSAFDQPSRQALLPQLVPIAIFPQAVTAASTVGQFAFVTGPIVGGILIARSGVASAYLAYGVLIALAAVALFLVQPKYASTSRRRITLEAVREGIIFLRRNQVALGAMTLDMFGVIFGGAVALLPVYATNILHVGAGGYGILTSAMGVGALMMSVLLLFLPPIKRTGATLLCAVASFGLMTMLFGISRSFPLSLLAYALTGASDQVNVIQRQAAVQLTTPDELRGRVNAVNALFIGASGQVGGIESGFVAAATNAVFAVVSGGAACVVVTAIIAATMPDLRRYRIGTEDAVIAKAQAAAGGKPQPEPEEIAGKTASAG